MTSSTASAVSGVPASQCALQETRPIRVLAFMEASTLTGPAKNLLQFAARAAQPRPGLRPARIAIATFLRSGCRTTNGFIAACRHAGVELHVIPERFAFDPRIIPAMRNLIGMAKPDIVQTHNAKSHFLMRLTRRHKDARWIAFQHGYTWPDLKMRLYNQLDRLSLPAAHQVITVCQPFAAALQKIGVRPERITVRHNAVEPPKIVPPHCLSEFRQSLGLQQNAFVLLTVSRLSREKGHLDLIEAVGRLRGQNLIPELRVVLVGDGPERHRLEAAAQNFGVSDCVIFAGHQTQVAPYYQMADVLVLPSHSEGSPNVLLEAMAAGVPVVATAVGGVPEIATHMSDALLVNRGDILRLARAIATLAEDKHLRERLAHNAIGRAAKYYPEEYSRSLIQVYLQVLARGTRHEGVPVCV